MAPVLAAFLFLAASAGSVSAGDYVHHCRSADGLYVMNDEQLQAFDLSKGREVGRDLAYKVLQKTTLAKRAGYCVANRAPAGQRRYNYAAETYALHIRFRENGQTIKTYMICEMASSGLPAAYNCDRDVTTTDWTIGTTASAPQGNRGANGPRWMHNGSQVRIVANGRGRRIEFVSPNDRMADRGVSPGDPLFIGRRNGNTYVGRAFVYSGRCPAASYNVSGSVLRGEARVVVTGRRPVLNRNCKVSYHRDVRLVFDRR